MFIQFSWWSTCPSCGHVHLMELSPVVIESQPFLFNARGICPVTNKEVLLETNRVPDMVVHEDIEVQTAPVFSLDYLIDAYSGAKA